MPTTIIFARHGEREDYAANENGRGKEWIANAQRPWDPPLTALGKAQASAAGKAVSEFLKKEKLAPVSHIFSSPFLRTAESALEMRSSLVAQSSTDLKLKVETSISELAAKAFFKSFGVKGHSTGKWGGSHAVRSMKAKELDALMIEQVHHGVSKLHNSANDLGGKLGDEAFDHAYAPFHDDTKADYTYNNPEHHRQVHTRLDRFVQHVLAAYENETVLCVSHGGIVAMGHYVVTKEQEYLHTGYSCVSIYSHHKTDDAFRPIVVASDQHLENVGSGKGGGDGR